MSSLTKTLTSPAKESDALRTFLKKAFPTPKVTIPDVIISTTNMTFAWQDAITTSCRLASLLPPPDGSNICLDLAYGKRPPKFRIC